MASNLKTTLDVTVTVTDVDEAPVITGDSAVNYAENGTGAVATYSASDPEGATVTLTLSGTDADSFSLSDGELTFGTSPDYETKSSYSVTLTASDQTSNESTLDITVTITDVYEAMTMAGEDSPSIEENSSDLAVATYTAINSKGATVDWSLEGTDKDDFTITDGALSLDESPDYEAKSSYSVTVKVTSGSESATLAVTVTVTDVDEDPVITGESAVNYAENGEGAVATYSASDPEDATVTLTLGGTDAASFSLSDGELTGRRPTTRIRPRTP